MSHFSPEPFASGAPRAPCYQTAHSGYLDQKDSGVLATFRCRGPSSKDPRHTVKTQTKSNTDVNNDIVTLYMDSLNIHFTQFYFNSLVENFMLKSSPCI